MLLCMRTKANKAGTARPEPPLIKNMPAKKRYRPESDGKFKRPYQKNRRAIIAAGDVCAICGRPIDKALKFPDPMSASVDHIIPISKGGHPSAPDNLQLVHLICNQMKSAKTTIEQNKGTAEERKRVGNRELPLSRDWQNWNGA